MSLWYLILLKHLQNWTVFILGKICLKNFSSLLILEHNYAKNEIEPCHESNWMLMNKVKLYVKKYVWL